MCKCVVFGGSATPFENFPSSSFLFEKAWLPYSFSLLFLFLNYRAFALFQQPMPLFIMIDSQRGYQHMSLMEQGVHKYGMVVAYFQCRSSIYIFGVYMILIKRYDKLLYSDQQGLTMLKTDKQLFVQAYHIGKAYIFVSNRKFSPSRNFQQGFLSFCKNKTPGCLNYSLDKLKGLL